MKLVLKFNTKPICIVISTTWYETISIICPLDDKGYALIMGQTNWFPQTWNTPIIVLSQYLYTLFVIKPISINLDVGVNTYFNSFVGDHNVIQG